MTIATSAVAAAAASPEVVIIGAKNGSGTVTYTTPADGPSIIKVGEVFTTSIVVTYTPAAAMAAGGNIPPSTTAAEEWNDPSYAI